MLVTISQLFARHMPLLLRSLGSSRARLQHEPLDCVRDAALIVGADHVLCCRSRLHVRRCFVAIVLQNLQLTFLRCQPMSTPQLNNPGSG